MTAALAGVACYFVMGILGFMVPRPRIAGALALAGGTISYALWFPGFPVAYLGIGDWSIPWRGDPLAATFWGLALFLHLVLLGLRDHPPRFHPLTTLLVGTTLSLVLSQDLFNLYVSLELTSLIAFLLVGMGGKPVQIWASLKYLILTSSGMIVYLLGLGFIYGETGTLSLLSPFPGASPALRLGMALLVAGAAAKGGVFLYAMWLPMAHSRAPSPVSALLSGLVVKMGIVVLARLARVFPVGEVLAGLGLVAGFLGILAALWEEDLKVFLAYSTMSQLGYMLLGLGWGWWEGSIAHALSHGLSKALLFLAAGRAEDEAGSRRIPDLAGALSQATRIAIALGSLSIVGFPLLAGYGAKGLLSLGAPPWGKWALFVLSVGTATSFAKLVPAVFRGASLRGRKAPAPIFLGLAVVAAGAFLAARHPRLLSPEMLLPSLGAIGAGGVLYAGLRRLRLPLPRWRLDPALDTFLLASGALALWFLLR